GESWNEPQESQERGALLRLQRAIVIRIKMRECHAQSSGLRRRHRDWIDSVRKKPVDDADRLRPVKRGGVFETRNRNQQEQQRHFIGGLLTVGSPAGADSTGCAGFPPNCRTHIAIQPAMDTEFREGEWYRSCGRISQSECEAGTQSRVGRHQIASEAKNIICLYYLLRRPGRPWHGEPESHSPRVP